MYKETKTDKIIKIILSVGTGFIVLLLSFIFAYVKTHASGLNTFPYNIAVNYVVDDNGTNKLLNSVYRDYIINEESNIISNINTYLNNANISYDSYIVCISDISNHTTNLHGAQPYSKIWFNVYINPTVNSTIATSNSIFDSSVSVNYTAYYRFVPFWRYTTGYAFDNQNPLSSGSGSVTLLGSATFFEFTPYNTTTQSLNVGYYSPNYPVLSYGLTNGIKDTSNNEVIVNRLVPTFPFEIGTAVIPGTLPQPNFDGLTPPEKVPPTYTINNYTWNTYNPPTPDFSTLEDAVQSLYDLVKYEWGYFRDNINGEFTTLQGNIKGLFEYIGQTIQYYGGLIIDAINNGVETFYNNMKALVENIGDKISYIVEPLDMSQIQTEITSSAIFTDYSSITSAYTTFKAVFENASEPNTYIIPLHLENVAILHTTQQNIDLSVILPVRPLIRAFCWTITTFTIFFTVLDAIPNFINGGGDE